MIIVITKVENPYLSFNSKHGVGAGYISDQQFELGKEYGVEFNFLPFLDTRANTRIGTIREAGFYHEDDFTLIVASVEHIDEDDDVCLRIAPDCMIMAYKNDDAIQVGDNVEVKLFKDELIITSIGV